MEQDAFGRWHRRKRRRRRRRQRRWWPWRLGGSARLELAFLGGWLERELLKDDDRRLARASTAFASRQQQQQQQQQQRSSREALSPAAAVLGEAPAPAEQVVSEGPPVAVGRRGWSFGRPTPSCSTASPPRASRSARLRASGSRTTRKSSRCRKPEAPPEAAQIIGRVRPLPPPPSSSSSSSSSTPSSSTSAPSSPLVPVLRGHLHAVLQAASGSTPCASEDSSPRAAAAEMHRRTDAAAAQPTLTAADADAEAAQQQQLSPVVDGGKSANANATASRAVLHAFLVALGDLTATARPSSRASAPNCPEPPFSSSASLPSAEKQRRREAWEQQREARGGTGGGAAAAADAAERYYWQALKLERGQGLEPARRLRPLRAQRASPSTITSSGTTSSGNNENGNGNGNGEKARHEQRGRRPARRRRRRRGGGVLCVARAATGAPCPRPWRRSPRGRTPAGVRALRQAERSAPAASALHGRTTPRSTSPGSDCVVIGVGVGNRI